MLHPAEEVTVRPEVVLLESLLTEVSAGKLRVPRFQRGFVWRPDQMIRLYDSIEHGYPIGSVLVWQTGERLHSEAQVAGIDIPPAPADEPVSYLLDGNQRLSTLFGTLARRPATPADNRGEQRWHIFRVLGGEVRVLGGEVLGGERRLAAGFVHWDGPGQPPAHFMPMQAVLRTVDFLRYARQLARDTDAPNELLEEAEQLTQRIRSYRVAVIRLVGGSLSHAVEAFARLNSAGQQISQLEMVSALTYRPGVAQNLNSRITEIQARVGAGGFGDIPVETVFRAVLAVAGERDVLDVGWAELARRVKGVLDGASAESASAAGASAEALAEAALHRVVRFLRYEAGVPLAWLVPYPLQVVLLARFFHLVPEPGLAQVRALVRWFWATSWSGALSEANSARVARIVDQIEEFAAGQGELPVRGHTAQPMPDWFDPDSGRSKAYILWELRAFDRRLGPDGAAVDAVELLAAARASAYRRVLAAEQEWWLSPANHLLFPTAPGRSIADALLDLPAHLAPAVLDSHGIPAEAMMYLRAALPPAPEAARPVEADQRETDDEFDESNGQFDAAGGQFDAVDAVDAADAVEAAGQARAAAERSFIRARAALLARRERAFMREMGIEYMAGAGDDKASRFRY